MYASMNAEEMKRKQQVIEIVNASRKATDEAKRDADEARKERGEHLAEIARLNALWEVDRAELVQLRNRFTTITTALQIDQAQLNGQLGSKDYIICTSGSKNHLIPSVLER